MRDIAALLRGEAQTARRARDRLRSTLAGDSSPSVLDMFGSDLPEEYFEGVFDQARRVDPPRDTEL